MYKHATVAIALAATPVAVLAGCSNQSGKNGATTTASSTSSATNPQQLTTQLKTADGKAVADATIDFNDGYATVTVNTVGGGVLSPGFHGMHIHTFGRCEPNSTAPNGGPSGDFLSAGGHLQVPGHTGQPASGYLPPLLVRSDGAGKLVTTTDAFTEDQLKGPNGSSIILHQGSALPGSTAGEEKRVACGVISPAGTTSPSTSTSTSTVTTTAAVPPATSSTTETTSPTSTTSGTSTTSTTTSATETTSPTSSVTTTTTTGSNG